MPISLYIVPRVDRAPFGILSGVSNVSIPLYIVLGAGRSLFEILKEDSPSVIVPSPRVIGK